MSNSTGTLRLRNACPRRSRYRVIGLVACVSALVAGSSRVQAQANGPAATYAFSEATGVTSVDSSQNGNDALMYGPTRTAAGRFGGGLQFDGVDDAVELPMTASLTFASAFTVEAWIAPTMFGHERSLWWTPATMLSLRADGTVVPVAVLTGGQVGFVSSTTVPLNTWSHVAMTYDGSMLRLYINGADAGSRAATGTLAPPWLEAGALGGDSAFAGTIDELRFYRRALSQTEIRLDSATPIDAASPLEISLQTPSPNAIGVVRTAMTATFSRAMDTSTVTTSTVQLLDSGNVVANATVRYDAATRIATLSPIGALTPLTSYTMRVAGGTLGVRDAHGAPMAADSTWTFRTAAAESAPSAAYGFSGTSAAIAVDSSGNGNDADLVDGAASAAGRFGNGLRLDGVDDAVLLPVAETLTFSNAFTVEAWISPTAFGRDRSLWWTQSANLTLRAEGTVVPVAVLTGGQVGFVSTGVVPVGTWSHVAMTYDGSMLRLYINGADAGSRAASGTLVPVSPPEGGILGGDSAFVGALDEMRLYRRALSAAEIAADMTAPVEAISIPFTVTATTPATQGVAVGATVSATFSRPADASSVTTATVQLRDSADHVVPASVSYDRASNTVTLTPTSPLAPATDYRARVFGGGSGVRAEDGGQLTADVQWSFRTAAPIPPPASSLPPHIAWVNDLSGPTGQILFVNGDHFGGRQGTSTLTFNGKVATVVYWSSTWIVVIVPSGATTGPMVVKVDGKKSNPVTFTITRPTQHHTSQR
jgi:hypothetical protein